MKMIRNALAALAAVACMVTAGSAATLGDDGLHKTAWMRETFKDLRDDLAEATEEAWTERARERTVTARSSARPRPSQQRSGGRR